MAQSASFSQFSKQSLTNVSLTPRMLLLESLQSKLLRCKLLEHLLDYACPLKISLPMSLSLLLHFLKNCTLAPDPTVNITLVSCFYLYLIGQPLLFPDVAVLQYLIYNILIHLSEENVELKFEDSLI